MTLLLQPQIAWTFDDLRMHSLEQIAWTFDDFGMHSLDCQNALAHIANTFAALTVLARTRLNSNLLVTHRKIKSLIFSVFQSTGLLATLKCCVLTLKISSTMCTEYDAIMNQD